MELSPPIGTPEIVDRHAITGTLTRLLDNWRLTPDERLDILGVPTGTPVANERATQILNMHIRLRTLFPHDRDLAYGWLKTPNRAFNGRAPVNVIRMQGEDGIQTMLAYLQHHGAMTHVGSHSALSRSSGRA